MSPSDVEELNRKVRRLELYAAGATLALGVVALVAFGPAADDDVETFETIEAERVDIVDPDGTRSLVLSNRQRFPDPVVGGEAFERSIQPAGLVLYDDDGNEMGGIAAVDVEDRGRRTLLVFDYRNSEAIGYSAGESAGGERYGASLTIADRIPLDADIREVGTSGRKRIDVQNEGGDASIVLYDPEENPRIRLYVTAAGETGIEMLSPEGEVVARLGGEGG